MLRLSCRSSALIALVCIVPLIKAQGIVIRQAQVIDGTGAPARRADVRVVATRIVQIAPSITASPNDTVIDAAGMVVAPGFIDLHNHSDRGLSDDPQAASQVSQGITTAVVGVDGSSSWPIADWVAKRRANPVAINLLTLVGHATVRSRAMAGGDYKRAAKPAEVDRMASLVDQAMREGAIGLSSGLEYEVGSYSTTPEVIALAKAAAVRGGLYMSHIRDEADRTFEAIEEVITIAREAGVPAHISHLKLGTAGVWGKAPDAVSMLAKARNSGLDITADCYPYDAWSSTITVLVPNKQYEDPVSVAKALADVGGPQNVLVTSCREHRDYEFQNLQQIAERKGKTAVDIFIEIVRSGGASVVGKAMQERDIRYFYAQPWILIASDGGIGMRHPRATGSFPKVLGRYVREAHWLPLEEAIRKMTSAPAARLGLKDRGVVREGALADLVIFDPKQVADQSTFAEPGKLSKGIQLVLVNGTAVWRDGQTTTARPGLVITGDELLSGRRK